MHPDPRVIREVLALAGLEHEQSQKRIPGASAEYLPWMPFQIPEFLALLAEAIPAAPGYRFLEVGAGVGTKMLLARELFGLDVTGIEISPALAVKAASLSGAEIECGDALDYNWYDEADLIWFYRPCRDPDTQAALEKTVWDGMAPGAVVICASYEARPPAGRFFPILEDMDRPVGIWQKLPPA